MILILAGNFPVKTEVEITTEHPQHIFGSSKDRIGKTTNGKFCFWRVAGKSGVSEHITQE